MTERDKGPIPLEIERKFLVKNLPEGLELSPHTVIIQGYVVITEDGTEVRVRDKGGLYFQTVKSGGGKTRSEVEMSISRQQFEALWPLTKGKRVEKTRYEISYENRVIELDVYHGDLNGLVTAEVEFDSEEVSNQFTPPGWLGQEVTEDRRYKNQNLALNGIPQVIRPVPKEAYKETF